MRIKRFLESIEQDKLGIFRFPELDLSSYTTLLEDEGIEYEFNNYLVRSDISYTPSDCYMFNTPTDRLSITNSIYIYSKNRIDFNELNKQFKEDIKTIIPKTVEYNLNKNELFIIVNDGSGSKDNNINMIGTIEEALGKKGWLLKYVSQGYHKIRNDKDAKPQLTLVMTYQIEIIT